MLKDKIKETKEVNKYSMSELKPCPFNLPLRAIDPWDTGSGGKGYPVIAAGCEGISVSGLIGYVKFKGLPYSGTGRYMDYDLAKEMAEYACNAINMHDEMYQLLDFLVKNDSINDPSIDKEVIDLLAKARGEQS